MQTGSFFMHTDSFVMQIGWYLLSKVLPNFVPNLYLNSNLNGTPPKLVFAYMLLFILHKIINILLQNNKYIIIK